MIAVRTTETDYEIGPPPGQEDEIGSLPAHREDGTFGEGTTCIFSVWEPSLEERKAIAAGQNIRLGVGWIGAFPPVSVGITHLLKVDE